MDDFKQIYQKHKVETVILGAYLLYSLLYMGVPSILFSAAIGLITYSFTDKMTLIVAVVILSGLLYPVLRGFYRGKFKETFVAESPEVISRRVQQMASGKPGYLGSVGMQEGFSQSFDGILSSDFSEGFENPDNMESTGAGSNGNAKKEGEATKESSSASVNASTVTDNLVKEISGKKLDSIVADVQKAVETKKDGKKDEKFQGSSKGQFELGNIPTETQGGVHIDAGTTLMKALGSLKPEQIKSMTADTQQLMETQKSLMGMLSSMKPMLSDSKQLLDTFNDMFGGMKMGSS